MPDAPNRAALRKCFFLQGLDEAEADAFLAAGREYRFAPGAFLFHQDDPAELFYIVGQGRVRLLQVTPSGHQVIVAHMGPAEALGIIVVLSNMNYPVSAEAIEASSLLAWNEETTLRFMRQHPQLALNGLQLIARQFHSLSERYQDLATVRTEQRVARALLRLLRQAGKRTESGVIIDMPLSRQDLAEMTGTTLYTVSRTLRGWELKGFVSLGRERVTITRPHDLVAIAEDLP